MKLLLDTHLLFCAAGVPQRLPLAARRLINAAANEPLYSAASLWEIAAKRAPGREDPFDRILIAQPIVESVTLLTVDAGAQYSGPVRRV